MKRAETLAAINDLERRFPVAEWTARGVRVWPLVRAALSWRSFAGYVQQRTHAPRHERLELVRQMAVTRVRSAAAELRDRSHRARIGAPYDTVFLASEMGKVRVGGAWYDRLCDPFRELLAKRGLTSLHLEPGRQVEVPRHHPGRYIQPALDLAILRSVGPPWPSGRLHLPAFDALERAARANGLDTSISTLPAVARQLRQLWHAAGFFERHLRRARAEHGFVISYGIPSMAFNLACARVGIGSTEIQHGVQGPLHWAYSRWSALPPGGYELLPDSYWVWGPEEAAVIEDWAAPAFPRHRPVAGGNLWLELWREGRSKVVEEADREVGTARRRSPGERHVLIPLHKALAGRSSLDPFLAAIAARPSWRWWVRSHPNMTAREAARAKRILAGVPGARLELEASELPLYAVLRHVDAVATMASSVVIEAAAMGVPSAITDTDVGEQYAGEISSGWAMLAEGSLVEALEAQIGRASSLPRYERPRLPAEDAFDRLLPASLRPDPIRATH